jgi:hypothetical protein
MGWNGSGEYSPIIDPPMDRRPEPGVDRLMVYIVVADDFAVRGSTSGISSTVGDGLGDLDRSLVMAEPGVAIVSPGDHFHSGIVAGVAVGEDIQELGDPSELRDRVRG